VRKSVMTGSIGGLLFNRWDPRIERAGSGSEH
jgi:hypothetical protein